MARLRSVRVVVPALFLAAMLLAVSPGPRAAAGTDQEGSNEGDYPRSVVFISVPEVTLAGTDGARVPLREVLNVGKPVMVNFIFTTCPSICPLMSAVFYTVREDLGGERERLRMVSITIDPENDTPVVLREYASRFEADDGWLFLTGNYADIVAVQQAFGAWQRSKMDHAPFTFLRRSPGSPWIRVEGILSAEDLGREARGMLREK